MSALNIFESIKRKENPSRSKEKEVYSPSQKSADIEIPEEAIKKEQKEDGIGKLDMFEVAVATLGGKLESLENAKIINEAVEEEGASEKLGEEILKYWENLGNKKVLPENNAKEIMRHIDVGLFGFVERAKAKGLTPHYKEVIKEEFLALREYLRLISSWRIFEKAELESTCGFLEGKIGKEKSDKLRGNRLAYINKCREIIEGEGAAGSTL